MYKGGNVLSEKRLQCWLGNSTLAATAGNRITTLLFTTFTLAQLCGSGSVFSNWSDLITFIYQAYKENKTPLHCIEGKKVRDSMETDYAILGRYLTSILEYTVYSSYNT